MGLSIAVSGGIVILTVLIAFSVLPIIVEQIFNQKSASSYNFEITDSISKTGLNITSIAGEGGANVINFNLRNNATEKLWNYEDFDLFITYDANIGGTQTRITERFTYNGTAAFQNEPPTFGLPGPTQFARPDGDVTTNNWNDDSANTCPGDGDGALWDEIDETSSDGCTTATESPNNPSPTNQYLEVSLSDPTDPQVDTGHIIRFDARKDGSTRTLTLFAELYEGTTLIATTGTLTLTQTFQTQTYTLSSPEAQSIGNYNNLNLRFVPETTGGGPANTILLSWAELEVPGAPTGGTLVLIDGLQPKYWTINKITNDNLDPRIINSHEIGEVVAQLSYPVFSNGFLQISISNDNGRVEDDSITVT